ncbi:MAG: hypothetical protein GY721_12410 [Deltaproteobacteria bacterium]|nr:hypothetical protein [Deltaproteobacteria bacterium]
MRAKEKRRELATSFSRETGNHALKCMRVIEWVNLRWDGEEGPWSQSEMLDTIREAEEVLVGIIIRKWAFVGGFRTEGGFSGWWYDSHGEGIIGRRGAAWVRMESKDNWWVFLDTMIRTIGVEEEMTVVRMGIDDSEEGTRELREFVTKNERNTCEVADSHIFHRTGDEVIEALKESNRQSQGQKRMDKAGGRGESKDGTGETKNDEREDTTKGKVTTANKDEQKERQEDGTGKTLIAANEGKTDERPKPGKKPLEGKIEKE